MKNSADCDFVSTQTTDEEEVEEEEDSSGSGGGGGGPALSRSSSDDDGDVAGDQDSDGDGVSDEPEDDNGEVLGVQAESCEPYLSEYIHTQKVNDTKEVIKLQLFLNTWMDTNLAVTGIYDEETILAVESFQMMYAGDVLAPWDIDGPTGNVYITTIAKINGILCNDVANQPLPNLVPIS